MACFFPFSYHHCVTDNLRNETQAHAGILSPIRSRSIGPVIGQEQSVWCTGGLTSYSGVGDGGMSLKILCPSTRVPSPLISAYVLNQRAVWPSDRGTLAGDQGLSKMVSVTSGQCVRREERTRKIPRVLCRSPDQSEGRRLPQSFIQRDKDLLHPWEFLHTLSSLLWRSIIPSISAGRLKIPTS